MRCKLYILLTLLGHQSLSQNIPFAKNYGGTANQRAVAIHELNSKNLLILGLNETSGKPKMELLKTNSNGDSLESVNFDFQYSEFPNFMLVKENENSIHIAYEQHIDNNVNSGILITDTLGNIIANQKIEDTSANIVLSEIAFHNNFIYGTGFLSTTNNSNNFLLIKSDLQGNIIWMKNYGDTTNEVASSLVIADENTIIISGDKFDTLQKNYKPFLMALDSVGEIKWQNHRTVWTHNSGTKRSCLLQNAIYTVGESSTDSSAYFDIYISKTDLNGNTIFEKTFPLSNFGDAGFDVKNISDSLLLITGYSHNISNNTSDMYALLCNANAEIKFIRHYHLGNVDVGYAVMASQKGGYYVVGRGQNGNHTDYFLAYDTTHYLAPLNIDRITLADIKILPNPSPENFKIRCDFFPFEIEIYTINGQKIISKKSFKNEMELNISEKGVFLAKIITLNFTETRKIIIY